jgi:hypothetical protein
VSIIKFEPRSEKMYYMKLKGMFCNTSITCAHAPTEEKEDLVKDDCYDELTRTVQKLSNHYRKIVRGDFNTNLGRDGTSYLNVGLHSLHREKNNNGIQLPA